MQYFQWSLTINIEFLGISPALQGESLELDDTERLNPSSEIQPIR